MPATLHDLPQIQRLLALPRIQDVVARFSQPETTQALRDTIEKLRKAILAGQDMSLPDFAGDGFAAEIAQAIATMRQPLLRPVINATGILIHTNLGRAPLAAQANAAVQQAALSPTNLELNLKTGKRGSRHDHVEQLICALTGAEAAVVVNNCAAAVLLSLMATAMGRNVVASRGELIEIGGSFRLPDVIAQSGAVLREVGATNKTRASDYENAIDDDTAVLLKSHTSNFKIVGFTAAPDRHDLAKLAQAHDVILMEDLGSGVLIDLTPYGLTDEPVVRDILKAGVDLVMFSGDKLLGGPQAGIIAGRRDIVARLKAHPLMRAVRIDKLSLAALEATLRLYRAPNDPIAEIPILQMLAEHIAPIEGRAKGLIDSLADLPQLRCTLRKSVAQVGGGTLPEQDLESYVVALKVTDMSAEVLNTALRGSPTPIIARIAKEEVLLDMRTLRPADIPTVLDALRLIAK